MLNLIVAPYDINSNAENYTKRIVKYLKQEKVEYSVYFSPTLNDIDKNVEELQSIGETEFVVIGDDLVLSQFINAVKDLSKIKLGVVPTSKHDDFASTIGLSHKPIQAIKDILTRHIETVDYLKVNNQKVLGSIVIGASTEIFEVYNGYKLKNILTKKVATMRYANKFEGIELGFQTSKNGKVKTAQVYELCIANIGLSKGRKINPLSNVKDGLFNFNYVILPEKEKRRKYLSLFKKGNQIYDENTKQQWLSEIKITNPDKRIKALVDGKILNYEEININAIEKGLKLYATIK
ncbi:MAG: hypothetical protein IKM43_04220 [Clostridia bacterium]|nr:hypothetical protein [Clostridia bacterium]